MKIKLLNEYRVLFAAGSEIEVDEREAEKLLALDVAVKAEEEKKPAKKKG